METILFIQGIIDNGCLPVTDFWYAHFAINAFIEQIIDRNEIDLIILRDGFFRRLIPTIDSRLDTG